MSAALAEGRRPDLAYTLADMAQDAVGLLDALSVRRAHVVGRSMGGMIAQILASEHPARVGSLTAIMSSTGNPGLPPAAPDAMALMMRPAPDPSLDEAGFVAQAVAVIVEDHPGRAQLGFATGEAGILAQVAQPDRDAHR